MRYRPNHNQHQVLSGPSGRMCWQIIGFCLFLIILPAHAQEVLSPSRIHAKSTLRQPPLGLPKRMDGQSDPAVWFDTGRWKGSESMLTVPFWTMEQIPDQGHNPDIYGNDVLAPVLALCAGWASERPNNPVDIVWGPYHGGWFVAICKKSRSVLGWKSIGFVIPPEGIESGKRIYDYSKSVNWLEHNIGYNLFPRLPSHLQDIIEEMTSSELICSYQEFDYGLDQGHDREIDYDREDDHRNAME